MKYSFFKHAIEELRACGAIEEREPHYTLRRVSPTGTEFVEYIFVHAYIIAFGDTVVYEVISPRESAEMLARIDDDRAQYIYDACLQNI